MNETPDAQTSSNITKSVSDVLSIIDQEREREIISRRFGLFDHKETLEQIGELLGITRERVRQLEKAILIRLKIAAEGGKIPSLSEVEKELVLRLSECGRVSRVSDLADRIDTEGKSKYLKAHIGFLAELSPKLTALNENDRFYHSVGISDYGDEKDLKSKVSAIVTVIKKHGEPITESELHSKIDGYEHPDQVKAMASLSKDLASLKNLWGLVKWPLVNPKNIRDKIYVILADNSKPMHFSDIAKAIKTSDFKRKNVTTQAIHNELIKDKRFVLIGRGIYALNEWGYKRGTVADIIAQILDDSNEPLHRDEIVRRVLKKRQVKETTILLNLQSKPQFKRVAKATYVFDKEKS